MQLVLFEDQFRSHFLPLTYTRPVGDLRMGMMTMAERYAKLFNTTVTHHTQVSLEPIFPVATAQIQLHINARLFPTKSFVLALRALQPGEALKHGDTLLAKHIDTQLDRKEQSVAFDGDLCWI
jgi:hypothetical protein